MRDQNGIIHFDCNGSHFVHMSINNKKKSNKKIEDGGYYAIKGFTFQFDKSLLEIIANPHQDIEIERIQDIVINKYYIQIKYKESQSYAPSKIKPAIIQLFQYFLSEKTSKFLLYCYFKDKLPFKKILTLAELDEIFGNDKGLFVEKDKEIFIKNFTLEFADNFDAQFKKVIKNIKNCFELKNEEESMIYHAIFRANLLEIATKKNPKHRTINITKLKNLINKNEKIILELAHCNYLKNSRYLAYLKKEYFTFKKINIPHRERLFVIEVDNLMKDADILQLIFNIQNRYFKKRYFTRPIYLFI